MKKTTLAASILLSLSAVHSSGTIVTIGSGTLYNSAYAPMAGYTTYPYTDNIYIITKTEITAASPAGFAGIISSIAFQKANACTYSTNDFALSIWMYNSSETTVSAATTFDAQMTADNPTLVYSSTTDNITATTGQWQTWITNGAFSWNGTSNIKVYIRSHMPSASCASPGMTWYSYNPAGLSRCLGGATTPPATVLTTRRAAMQLDFRLPNPDAGISTIVSPADPIPAAGTYNVDVTLNYFNTLSCYPANLTSVKINWQIDGVTQTQYSWTGTLAYGSSTTVTIGSFNFSNATHFIKIWTSLPNGGAGDANNANDTIAKNFLCSANPVANIDWGVASVALNNTCTSASTYTFSLSTTADPNSQICSYNTGGTPAGTASITFPAGITFQNNLIVTFNGLSVSSVTKSGTTLTFNVPGNSSPLINTNTAFTISVGGVINPPAGSYSFAANSIQVKNMSGGWNQHSVTTPSFSTTACTYAQTVFQVNYQATSQGLYGAAHALALTSDGGYATLGFTATTSNSFLPWDIYLTKTDALGNQAWSSKFNDGGNHNGFDMVEAADGGLICAYSTTGQSINLLKVDPTGMSVQWSNRYGNCSGNAMSVARTSDGGYIIGGTSTEFRANFDACLVKVDASGNFQWNATYSTSSGSNSDRGASAKQTADGGYVLFGTTINYTAGGTNDFYLIKTNSAGGLGWAKAYGTTDSEWGYSVSQTSDGGYVMLGTIGSTSDALLVKASSLGALQWARRFGGTAFESMGSPQSLQITSDGGLILDITSSSYGFSAANPTDINTNLLIKTDFNGNLQWSMDVSGMGYFNGRGVVRQTTDGGYAIASTTRTTMSNYTEYAYLIKTDQYGQTACKTTAIMIPNSDVTLSSASITFNSSPASPRAGSAATNAMPFTPSAITGDYSVLCTPVPLPLEITYFTAEKTAAAEVLLRWASATENNMDYYIPERSSDGIHFEPVGRVKANGDSHYPTYYSFTDAKIIKEKIRYYRLRETDINGGYAYSEIITVKGISENSFLNVYPNPAQKELICELKSERESAISISVTDVLGNVIYREQKQGKRGISKMEIPVYNLPRGVYFLSINNDAQQFQAKFIKE